MHALKRHKVTLLTIVSIAQLGYLIQLPATRSAAVLLAHAVVSSSYAVYALLAPCLLGFGVVFNQRLKALDWRWLEWSLWHQKSNLALVPLANKWLWAPYGLLLAGCMPLLAFFEEIIFRAGTNGWLRGLLWGGLAFGLLHLLSCVTVRMAIYLAIVGVFLVDIYMRDGLLAVFVIHANYNLLTLTLLIADAHLKRAPALFRRAGSRLTAAI
jgi:hypothetical protein